MMTHERVLERNTSIRTLNDDELVEGFNIMVLLRPHLSLEQFMTRVHRQWRLGYECLGAFAGGVLVGVMGMRPVETLADGPYLHVDDIVIRSEHRGRGIGRMLLRYAESEARRRGYAAVFLDARVEASGFCESLGYSRQTSVLMQKQLDGRSAI